MPFPSPGDPPDPEIEPGCPALLADSLKFEPPGKPQCPYKKEEFGYRPHKEKTTDDGGRDWSDVSTNQGAPRTAGHAQKLEEAGKDPLGEICGAET